MRIALLQLDARIGDPEANGRALETAYRAAVDQGAQLVLTPEMAVEGYLSEDRLWEGALRRRIQAESLRLAALTGEVPLVLGTCSPAPSGRLYNELWWCEAGQVRTVVRKRILADYDVFDEGRYFEAGPGVPEPVSFRGHRVGLCICEDLWAGPEVSEGFVDYGFDPVADLVARGATLVLNASASPAHLASWRPRGTTPAWGIPSKATLRRRVLEGHARRHGIPVAYVNRVGAESWHVFDGGSGLVQPEGGWQGCADFHSAVHLVDTELPGGPWPEEPGEGAWLAEALGLGLRANLAKQGLEGVVLGLSGGIDSAVVVAMAARALGPERVLGVALPTRYTSRESLELAREQAQHLGVHHLELDADLPFQGFEASLGRAFPDRTFSLTDENLQSRSRGSLLMALTSEPEVHARLGTSRVAVLNTGNKSECATGYFTLYGDGIGALGILGDCLKDRVFQLARHLHPAVPMGVLERPPTAELRPHQTDEASLLPYRQLDAILGAHVEARREAEGLAEDLAAVLAGEDLAAAREALPRVLRLVRGAEFKRRQLPFALKVSPLAFGRGRRIPLTGVHA